MSSTTQSPFWDGQHLIYVTMMHVYGILLPFRLEERDY